MTPESPGLSITDQTVQTIAERAAADPRSVVRRLAGLPVRGRAGARIDRELQARGLVTSAAPPDGGPEAA